MRQADSTIKGYLYQFNKSLLEIFESDETAKITVEGAIEDIDIECINNRVKTIQCKYHEDEKYQISSVAVPITEMLCHFCESKALNMTFDYILYAYFADNVSEVDMSEYIAFLEKTKNKDFLTKYFHRIYEIDDNQILAVANKSRKTDMEKKQLVRYYDNNRENLKLKVDIQLFWEHFKYVKAKKFDVLKEDVIRELYNMVDVDTANNLYYPNALAHIAEMSANEDIEKRTITKRQFLTYLTDIKTVMITRWNMEVLDAKTVLMYKKRHLSNMLGSNPEVRTIVFSKKFIDENRDGIFLLVQQYIDKYYRKVKLQKPPIFIFDNSDDIMNNVIMSLHKYQKPVNTGQIAGTFMENSFINNTDCAADFVCKIARLSDINDNILEKCKVNQMFWIGALPIKFESFMFEKEVIDIVNMHNLKYLFGLESTMEVK